MTDLLYFACAILPDAIAVIVTKSSIDKATIG
jgi:hypothetical protein